MCLECPVCARWLSGRSSCLKARLTDSRRSVRGEAHSSSSSAWTRAACAHLHIYVPCCLVREVAYFFCESGSPRWTPLCSLTHDMVERIGAEMMERALEQRAADFGLSKEVTDGDVEWTLKEQHARLFCVEFLHAEHDQLFEVVSGPTGALERLLERLDDFDQWRAGHMKAGDKKTDQLTFAIFMQQRITELESKLPRKRPRLSGTVTKAGAELESSAVESSAGAVALDAESETLLLFHFLAACSVIVVPKLSHLATTCSPQKWSHTQAQARTELGCAAGPHSRDLCLLVQVRSSVDVGASAASAVLPTAAASTANRSQASRV